MAADPGTVPHGGGGRDPRSLVPITIDALELRRIELPFLQSFRSSTSTWTGRDVLIVRVFATAPSGPVEGWGECVAPTTPTYTSEFTAGAHVVSRDHLVPRLLNPGVDGAAAWRGAADDVIGHPMAKAAFETALVDAQLRAEGRSLAEHLGATTGRVRVGATIGIRDDLDDTVAAAVAAAHAGYERIKIKVGPGADVEPVARLRHEFGDDVGLQVDANCSYTPDDPESMAALQALDDFALLMIEQPFARDAVAAHAELAARLDTPICLDETIVNDAVTADVLDRGAADVINVKWGRVGGLDEAMRIVRRCRDRGIGLWHGGMFETGIGRAVGLALAAVDGFTLPADLAAADRYWIRDIVTRPATLDTDGTVAVPDGAGIGVDVDLDFVDSITTSLEEFRPA